MPYKITLLPSNKSFSCSKEQNILQAALENDLTLPFGCQSGSCGACVAKVSNGDFSYPDGEPEALTEADKKANNAFLCQAHPASDMEIEVALEEDTIQSKIVPVKVIEKTRLTHDIIKLVLKLPVGEDFPFHAGQYIDFLLKDGKKRSFSLACPPQKDNTLELHIRHVEGGMFTDLVFNELNVDEIMRIEGPLGSFYLRTENNRPIIMMGGGTGFAPLKGMIEQAINDGLNLDIHLFWGVRAKKDLYMLDLIKQWQQKLPKLKFNYILSEPEESDKAEETGFVHESVIRHYNDLSAFDLYMCGPPVMIDASRKAVLEHGLLQENMFSDSFDFQK